MKPRAEILDDGTVLIYGVIGDWWEGLDAATFARDLQKLQGQDEVRVLINSPGGDVADGIAIYNGLRALDANVTTVVTGIAASMASIIALAGDEVVMAEGSLMMIHDPWSVAWGNSTDLRRAADVLDKFGISMSGIYEARTGMSEAEVDELMKAETWFTADEAVEAGLADRVSDVAALPEGVGRDIDAETLEKVVGDLPMRIAALVRPDAAVIEKPEPSAAEPGIEVQDDAPDEPDASQNKPEPQTADGDSTEEGIQMNEEERRAAALAERERIAKIQGVAAAHELGDEFAQKHVDAGSTVETVNAAALDALADREPEGPSVIPTGHVGVVADETDKFRDGAAASILARTSSKTVVEKVEGQKIDAGEFRGHSLLDLARASLERNGISTRGMRREQIAAIALGRPVGAHQVTQTTSDFPVILENVLNKMLMSSYAISPDKWRMFSRVGSVSDFRAHKRLNAGFIPTLQSLYESGEIKQLAVPDAEAESITADTKAGKIGIGRKALVNDDVDFFSRAADGLGRAAARAVEVDLFALFALNSGYGPSMTSGSPLFDASAHGNVLTSGAAAPNTTNVEAARVLMARQQDPNSQDFLDIMPQSWVGPTEQEGRARIVNASEFEVGASSIDNTIPNTVNGLFDQIVGTPRLTGNPWYLFADPTICPVMEVAFLDGREEPILTVADRNVDFDGIIWSVTFDYGVAAVDYRGAVMVDY